jgi:hypothetical protein
VLADEFIDLVNVNYSLKEKMVEYITNLVENAKKMFEEFWRFLPRILQDKKNDQTSDMPHKYIREDPEYQKTVLYGNGWYFKEDIESEIL